MVLEENKRDPGGMPRMVTLSRLLAGVSVLFIIIIIGLGFYILRLGFSEDVYCKKGSIAYFALISSRVVKEFPVIGPTGLVTYYSSCGGGAAPPTQGVEYFSENDVDSLKTVLTGYLTAQGYSRLRNHGFLTRGSRFGKSGVECEFSVQETKSGNSYVFMREFYWSMIEVEDDIWMK